MADFESNHIVFDTQDLLCKWGFEDGGMLDDIIEKYFGCLLLNEKVLSSVIKTFVIPHLVGDIGVSYEVSTSHNPVRISYINGEDVSDSWIIEDKPDVYPKKVIVNIPIMVMYIKQNISDFFVDNNSIIEIVGEYGKCEGFKGY